MSYKPQKRIRKAQALRGLFVLFFLAQAIGQTDRSPAPNSPARPQSIATQKFTFHEDFATNAGKGYSENLDWNVWNRTLQLSLTNGVIHDQPVIIADPIGNAYVAWFDYRMGNMGIYVQKLDSSGNRLWPSDLRIQAQPWLSNMAMLCDEEGKVFLFWLQLQTTYDDTKADIYCQGIDPTGSILYPAGGKVILSDFSQSGTRIQGFQFPKFAYLNNSFYITWFATQTDLHLQKVDRNGNRMWSTNKVIYRSPSPQTWYFEPAISPSTGGDALILWRECKRDGWCNSGGFPTDTFAQRISKDGDSIWAQPIHVSAAPSLGEINAATDELGNSVFVWADYSEMDPNRPNSNSYGIYAQKLDPSGSILWNPRGIKISAYGSVGDPQVQFNPAGFFVVSWHGQSQGNISLQAANGDGSLRWVPEVVVNLDSGLRYRKNVTMDVDPFDNSVRIAWLDKNVYGQKISSKGLHLWSADCRVNEVLGSSSQSQTAMVSDGNEWTYVSWVDDRNVNPNLYLQRVDTAGHRLWDADVQVNSDTRLVTSNPALAVDPSGNVTVLWYRDYFGIMAQRFDPNGNRLWQNDIFIMNIMGSDAAMRATTDKNGNTLLAVISNALVSNVYTSHTYLQKLDPLGIKLWPDGFYIDTLIGNLSRSVDIKTDAEGNVFVAWRHLQIYDSQGIFIDPKIRLGGLTVQKLSAVGNKLWSDSSGVTLNDSFPNRQLRIALESTGVMNVLWSDQVQKVGDRIFMQKFDLTGSPVWNTSRMVCYSGSNVNTSLQEIVPAEGNNLFLFFSILLDARYIQKIDSEGASAWADAVKVSSSSYYRADSSVSYLIDENISAALNGNSQVLTMWREGISTASTSLSESSLFVQTFAANGATGLPAGTKFIDPERFYLQSGRAVSAKVNSGTAAVDSAILTAEYDNNGGSAAFYLSNDGGTTWTAAVPGIKTVFSTVGSDLRWKAELQVDPVWPRSPMVTGVSIEYTTLSGGGTDAYETDDSCAEARPIDVNGAHQQHNFGSSADEDWEWFDVRAGFTYSVQVTNAQSNADPALALYSGCSAQPLVTFDSPFTRDAQITRQATASGRWYVRTTNTTPSASSVKTAYHLTVREMEPTPVVLVVVGKASKSNQQNALNATGDLACRTFIKTGMAKANLRYYRPTSDVDLDGNGSNDDVTGQPTVAAVKNSIQDWAREQGVSLGIPFYVVLIGSGSADRIVLDNGEEVTTSDLGLWLSNLEATSGADNINLILDAPQSGTFLDVTVASPGTVVGRNRIVIASTSATQSSYLASDRSFFAAALFKYLGEKKSLADAFLGARQSLTATGLSQDPQIDVNGQGAPAGRARVETALATPVLIESPAAERGLNPGSKSLQPVVDTAGCGMSGSECVQVNAVIRDDVGVSEAWLEVYRPADVTSGEALVATTRIGLTVKGSNLYGVDGIRIGSGQNIYVMVRDTDGNLGDAYQIAGTNIAVPSVHTISGLVTAGATGVPGVTMGGLPGSPATNGSGNYTATVNAGWSGVVTPVKTGYSFSPVGRSYTSLSADQTGNYTATVQTFTISGNVGIAGAILSYLDGTVKTVVADSSGNYTLAVSYNWSGAITVSKMGYLFTPSSLSLTNVTANLTGQNFTARSGSLIFLPLSRR